MNYSQNEYRYFCSIFTSVETAKNNEFRIVKVQAHLLRLSSKASLSLIGSDF